MEGGRKVNICYSLKNDPKDTRSKFLELVDDMLFGQRVFALLIKDLEIILNYQGGH